MDSDMKSIKSHFFAGRFISKKPVETRLEFVFGLETRMDTGREQWFSLAEILGCGAKKGEKSPWQRARNGVFDVFWGVLGPCPVRQGLTL